MVNQDLKSANLSRLLGPNEVLHKLENCAHFPGPFRVYSTILGGWTDSSLGLFVALDDHGFHRGDGVFEALRVVNKKIYLLESHWKRMVASAGALDLDLPIKFEELEKILQAGIESFSGEPQLMIRLFLTRGPGGFSTAITESKMAQFFAVILPFVPYSKDKYESGVRLGKSRVPIKAGILSSVKSLNYLPNVMMKTEAFARGFDFMLNFSEGGVWGESSTENVIAINKEGVLCHPPLAHILKGCTMSRLFDLVESAGLLSVSPGAMLREQDLRMAQCLMLVGTTLDVLPVCEFEGTSYEKNPWPEKFREMIRLDQGPMA